MSIATEKIPTPTHDEIELARQAGERLHELMEDRKTAVRLSASGERRPVTLPRAAVEFLSQILDQLAAGNAVTIVPIPTELSSQQAADILGVSRPFLIEQMEAGKLPFRRVGTHRRIRHRDLMTYKRQLDGDRENALDKLAAQAQELKLGY